MVRLAVLLIAATAFSSVSFGGFRVEGRIASVDSGDTLTLSREDFERRARHSVAEIPVLADGAFFLDVDAEAGVFALAIPGGRSVPLAIEEGQSLTISESRESNYGVAVVGSPGTSALWAYEEFRKESLARLVTSARRAISVAKGRGASAKEIDALTDIEVERYAAHRNELSDYVLKRVGNSIALYATASRWSSEYRLGEIRALVDAFVSERGKIAASRALEERIRIFERTAIGALATNLSGTAIDGERQSLDTFRGKLVLVDFWASWCPPCRRENILYSELREKYGARGFEIFAVNLDSSATSWRSASKRDGVEWAQISDGKGWKSPLAATYGVTALPANFLLDADGRIVAKNLRGSDLEEALIAYFR